MTDDYNPDIESYSDYRDRINTMADVIEEALEDDPDLYLSELVFEEVDSSRIAMFTHEAIAALKHSDSEPEEWKHLVADDDSWQDVIRAMAFDMARIDLWEELHDRGVEQ